jgi:hypothetical protein
MPKHVSLRLLPYVRRLGHKQWVMGFFFFYRELYETETHATRLGH